LKKDIQTLWLFSIVVVVIRVIIIDDYTFHGGVQFGGQFHRGHGFHRERGTPGDHALDEQRRLVGLEGSDKVPGYVLGQAGGLFDQFLDVIFSKVPVPSLRVRFQDGRRGLGLADGHQTDRIDGPAVVRTGLFHGSSDDFQIGSHMGRGGRFGRRRHGKSWWLLL